jgi:hypothetical protein
VTRRGGSALGVARGGGGTLGGGRAARGGGGVLWLGQWLDGVWRPLGLSGSEKSKL